MTVERFYAPLISTAGNSYYLKYMYKPCLDQMYAQSSGARGLSDFNDSYFFAGVEEFWQINVYLAMVLWLLRKTKN